MSKWGLQPGAVRIYVRLSAEHGMLRGRLRTGPVHAEHGLSGKPAMSTWGVRSGTLQFDKRLSAESGMPAWRMRAGTLH